MTRTINRIGIVLGTLSLVACVGSSPGNGQQQGGPDADLVEAEVDAGPVVGPAPLEVSGTVIDYFQNNLTPGAIVADATLSTDGLDPAILATASPQGLYAMDILPASLFYVNVDGVGYATSKNSVTQVLDVALVQDQFAASTVGIARQYVGAGAVGTPILQIDGSGIIMLDISRNNGAPAIDVPFENIVLTTVADPLTPIGTAFLVDPANTDIAPNDVILVTAIDATTTRARGAFINVLPGDYTITVTIPAGGGGNGGIQVVQATVLANGATFVNTAGAAGEGGGGGQAAIVLDPLSPLGFTEDIHPILMAVADGGDGCVSCHDAAHVLPYIGTPVEVLARLNEVAVDPVDVLRLNLLEPALSPFVMNPVYEAIPNHPNAFWTVNSNHYKGIIAWIEQGASIDRAGAVLPIPVPPL